MISLKWYRLRWIAMCAASVILVTACGFHLRGSFELPPGLENIAIDDVSTTSDIAQVIKTQLRRYNITPKKKIEDAELVIVIDGETHQRRVMTVSPEGKVQEFELLYVVKYSLLNRQNPQASVSDQSLAVKRDLRFDETAVLGVTSEEDRLKREMVNSAAQQLLRRLQNVATARPEAGN